MKKKITLLGFVILINFILVSYTNIESDKHLMYSSIKNINSTFYGRFDPRSFYEKQCSFCHNKSGKIGPPMGEVKKVYLEKYPNYNDFVKNMTAFVLNPVNKNRLIKENKGIYGIMPPNMFKDSIKIKKVVQYIYKNIKIKKSKNQIQPKKTENKNQTVQITLEVNKGTNLSKYLNLNKINFKRNSIKLEEKYKKEVDKVIKFLKNNEHINIEIRNYTDAVGSTESNLKISAKRAQIIKNYMILKGIDPQRIKTKGYGETHLLNHCSDNVKCSEAEHEVNRRTEFIII